jgi:hypothetical protein
MPRDARGDQGDFAAGGAAARVFAGELERDLCVTVHETTLRRHSMCEMQ